MAVSTVTFTTAHGHAEGLSIQDTTSGSQVARQIPLSALAAKIHNAVSNENLVGYAGTEFDISGLALILYWKDSIPAAIAQILLQAPVGVTTVVRPARYSLKELDAEERRLAHGSVSEVGAEIISVAPSQDYSGLDVTVSAGEGAALPAINTDFPVHVARGLGVRRLANRQADTPPFWGGSVIQRPGEGCSTGFSAKTSAGTQVILTDQHCGGNQTWINGDGSSTVGTSSSGVASVDAMYISGRTYQSDIYIGDYMSATGTPVDAALRVSVNQLICLGGGWSGEVCNNKVITVNQFFGGVGPGFKTTQVYSQGAAGDGDSGGPAYAADGMGGVVAYGLIEAGIIGDEATCTGISGRVCYWGLFSTNIGDDLGALGLNIQQAYAHFNSSYNGRCLDADTGTIGQNGTKVQLWDCRGTANQSWYFPGDGTIRNLQSGRCLDADTSTGGVNGTKVQLWDCLGNGNQAWTMPGDGTIRNWQYGRCLDAQLQTIGANGTKMQIYDCNGGSNQRWYRS